MKSKMSSSNISAAFMVENFKRFWLGSLFAFLGYFMACVIPVAVNRSTPEFIGSIIKGGFPLAIPLVLIIPMFAAILVYRFLQTTSSSAIVHALPFSRKQIFNSSFLSGIILCIVPIVLTAVLLLVFRVVNGPVMELVFDPNTGFSKHDVLSASLIVVWMVKNCILTSAVFTASMAAAMLTGSSIMQGVLSLVIVLLVPVTTAVISGTAEIFVYGYVSPDFLDTLNAAASPIFTSVIPEWKYVISQLIISIILFVLGWLMYKKRNIEKASDTLVFGFSKPVVKYYLTFIGMCACGLLTYSIQGEQSLPAYFTGAVIGAIAIFLGLDVAINRNFNVRRLGLGIVKIAAAMVVISLILTLDLTGYESRIPDADDVKGVQIEGLTTYEYDNRGYGINGEDYIKLIENPETVALVQAMHADIIEEKDSFFGNSLKNIFSSEDEENYGGTIVINYVMKDGSTVKRSYEVPIEFYEENESVNAVVENWDYKMSVYPVNQCTDENAQVNSIMIDPSYEGTVFRKNTVMLDESNYERFLEAMTEDLKAIDGYYMCMTGVNAGELLTVNVTVSADAQIDSEINEQYYKEYGYYYSEPVRTYTFNVNRGYTNTINLLKELGIYESLIVLPEDVDRVVISKQQSIVHDKENWDTVEEAVSEAINDPEQIREIMEKGSLDMEIDEDGYYYEAALYPAAGASDECIYRYFMAKDAPEFIKALF